MDTYSLWKMAHSKGMNNSNDRRMIESSSSAGFFIAVLKSGKGLICLLP